MRIEAGQKLLFRKGLSVDGLGGFSEIDIDGFEDDPVFFDGKGARGKHAKPAAQAVEVLFSGGGQTADDLIERAAHRFQDYGEVLVVTDDFAERDTVSASGASVASCGNFIRMIDQALAQLQDSLNRHNRAARNSFRGRQ